MDDRREARIGFWVIALIAMGVVSIALYVGAYLWMVEPERWISLTEGMGPWTQPSYRWGSGAEAADQEFWSKVFAPIHDLDRRVRPKKWDPDTFD